MDIIEEIRNMNEKELCELIKKPLTGSKIKAILNKIMASSPMYKTAFTMLLRTVKNLNSELERVLNEGIAVQKTEFVQFLIASHMLSTESIKRVIYNMATYGASFQLRSVLQYPFIDKQFILNILQACNRQYQPNPDTIYVLIEAYAQM